MTILTRIILHNDSRSVIHLLKSRERIHALTLRGLPDNDGNNHSLWRCEDHDDRTFIYVLSDNKPDYGFINAKYDLNADIRSTSYDGLLRSLHNGQKYSFQFECNPTMSTKKNMYDSRGKRIPIVGENAREWVVNKLGASGLTDIILADNHSENKYVFTKNHGEHQVTLRTQSYNGLITVDDEDTLKKALVNGIGPAKAYGCGMLILSPRPQSCE